MPNTTKHMKGHPGNGGLFIAMGDAAAFALAFLLSAAIVKFTLFGGQEDLRGYIPSERYYLNAAICFTIMSVFFTHGHYTHRLPWWNQIKLIALMSVFGLTTEGAASFLLDIRTSGWFVITNWVLATPILMGLRSIFFRVRKEIPGWAIPTVIIGDTSTVVDVLYAFNADTSTGYDVQRVLTTEKDNDIIDITDLPKRYANLPIECRFDSYEDYIAEHPEFFYVIVLDTFKGVTRDRIVEALNRADAAYAVVPSTSKISLYEMEPRHFFGFDVMLLYTRSSLSHPLTRFSKRLIDIASTGAALLMFAPVFVFAILAQKLEGHEGSIFYGGERVGQDGKLFKCWKFRTMAPDSDHLLQDYLDNNPDAKAHWEKYFKLPKDPRVKTKTAGFLRKSSLDEIPQLWNVFIGDMSLVGPRPILPEETIAYGERLSDYMKVKPGITGLWQVSGRNSVSFQRRVYWDSWYVRNWTLWGDIVIILKTIPAVLIRTDGHA